MPAVAKTVPGWRWANSRTHREFSGGVRTLITASPSAPRKRWRGSSGAPAESAREGWSGGGEGGREGVGRGGEGLVVEGDEAGLTREQVGRLLADCWKQIEKS